MNGFHVVYGFIVGAIVLMAALAAFSRIATLPNAPGLVSDGADALSRLFQGAFGQ